MMRHMEYMKKRLREEKMKDMVNHPEHYTNSSIKWEPTRPLG